MSLSQSTAPDFHATLKKDGSKLGSKLVQCIQHLQLICTCSLTTPTLPPAIVTSGIELDSISLEVSGTASWTQAMFTGLRSSWKCFIHCPVISPVEANTPLHSAWSCIPLLMHQTVWIARIYLAHYAPHRPFQTFHKSLWFKWPICLDLEKFVKKYRKLEQRTVPHTPLAQSASLYVYVDRYV